jgi:hypothetical protein
MVVGLNRGPDRDSAKIVAKGAQKTEDKDSKICVPKDEGLMHKGMEMA